MRLHVVPTEAPVEAPVFAEEDSPPEAAETPLSDKDYVQAMEGAVLSD